VKLCTTVWLGNSGALITLAAVAALYVLSSACSTFRVRTSACRKLFSCTFCSCSSRLALIWLALLLLPSLLPVVELRLLLVAVYELRVELVLS
jgi:hypothetical protein